MIGATLFSGIGAPEMATPSWRWPWHAEIEPFPAAVMKARHPQSKNLGDVTADDFATRAAAIASPDVLVFGSPCQSFSVAGKRLGLDDPRGNLALVALRVVGGLKPRWFVFENVPGLLSSDEGRDFGAFLGVVGQLGYGFAYRVLDAQFFGVPQRRRRVFVVGCLGDWRRAAAVLFEPESLRGDSAPGREAREGVAGRTSWGISPDCFDRSGEAATGTAADRSGLGVDDDVAYAIRAKRPGGVAFGGNNQSGSIDVATAVNAHGGPHGRLDFESETFVTLAPIAFTKRGDGTTGLDIAPSYDTGGGGGIGNGMAIAFSCKDHGADAGNTAPTLRAMGHDGSHANAGGQLAVALDLRNGTEDGVAQTLQAAGIGTERGGNPNAIPHTMSGSAVRRLTPEECEALQGFWRGYTAITYRGKPAADGPRYKALGNSMAVPVMQWILTRIEQCDAIQHARAA